MFVFKIPKTSPLALTPLAPTPNRADSRSMTTAGRRISVDYWLILLLDFQIVCELNECDASVANFHSEHK